ncbi:hypothetical protein ACMDB5_00700 [Flavobacterium sp. W1B]|uniref:hypothetical protein n=1 Tax=Flavobacterium sp. W1B TaxID=3394146 RepID=UPI0039BC8802
MKKVILAAVAVFAFSFANAQEGKFKLGAHVGLPMGDIKDSYSLNLGVDVAYLWDVADQFKAGVTTGYTAYLGKTETFDFGFGISGEIKNPTIGFIPVAGTAQYSLSDNLFVGADLGYAIYAGEGEGDGGFLYQPKFGYQTEKIEFYAGYKGISSDGATAASINLGFNYKF